jgi:hypothetical protein
MAERQLNVYVRFVGRRSTDNGRRSTHNGSRSTEHGSRTTDPGSRTHGLKKRVPLPK